jgi:small conductance mechanosensitive channel
MEGNTGFQLSNLIGTLTELVTEWGLKVIGALALLIVGMWVAKAIRASLRKALRRSELDPTLIPFLSGIVYYLVLAVLITAVLSLFGIETTSLIAVLGAAGFAVGLAMQGTLSNFSAGVMLLLFRPFTVGDFIDAAGVAGKVHEIGIFSTTLNTADNVRIILPNSAVYGTTIKNFTTNDNRRNDLVIGIGYGDDIGLAADTIMAVLKADSRVLADPEPTVAVAELADSSVNLNVRPWCSKDDYWPLRGDLNREIKERLEAAGVSIPYPQTDVHMHQVT